LGWLLNQKKIQGKLARYLNTLSLFDFNIEYRKGLLNIVADALSRPPERTEIEQYKGADYNRTLPSSSTELVNDLNKIQDNEIIINNKEVEKATGETQKNYTEWQTGEENNEENFIINSPIVPSSPSVEYKNDVCFDELAEKLTKLNINTINTLIKTNNKLDNKLRIKLLHPHVILPSKKHNSDAGFDVTTVKSVSIEPGQIISIPLGFSATPPKDTFLKIEARSSLAKQGIVILGGIIDQDYTGELIVMMTNINKIIIKFNKGD
jgi:dUTPase